MSACGRWLQSGRLGRSRSTGSGCLDQVHLSNTFEAGEAMVSEYVRLLPMICMRSLPLAPAPSFIMVMGPIGSRAGVFARSKRHAPPDPYMKPPSSACGLDLPSVGHLSSSSTGTSARAKLSRQRWSRQSLANSLDV